MAPVIQRLHERKGVVTRVLATAQHREMLDQVFAEFGITPDHDLDLMVPRQALASLTSRCIEGLEPVMLAEAPDVVIAEGDTTTVFATALVAFYNRIPFAHVEAGLRTWDYANPFPEEFNRQAAGKLAALHFAPTDQARANLLREGGGGGRRGHRQHGDRRPAVGGGTRLRGRARRGGCWSPPTGARTSARRCGASAPGWPRRWRRRRT